MTSPTAKPTFRSALAASLSLLIGFGILMLGDGLQGTLLAVRADQEGFSASTTGLIMSFFYFGFLGGSLMTPKIVVRVGHIRVFAALAALASAAILIHAVFVDIYVWIGLRLISGFCFAGLYVVAESWLNDKASNEIRGKVLSLYMIVTFTGVGLGQLLLNLADPMGYPLFILTSVLISIAVIPLLLSASPSPKFESSESMKLAEMLKLSPLGSLGMFVNGLVMAGFFALGPVYAGRIDLDLAQISYFMTAAVIGTVLLQLPIGIISDRFDRRWIIIIIAALAAVITAVCAFYKPESFLVLLLLVAIFGGLAIPLYSLCIAYINDCLDPSQMVAASGSLVLISGIGAVSGPILIAAMMDRFGNGYFFGCMSGVLGFLVLFGLLRLKVRRPVQPHKRSSAIPTGYHPSSTVIENMQEYAKDETQQDDE